MRINTIALSLCLSSSLVLSACNTSDNKNSAANTPQSSPEIEKKVLAQVGIRPLFLVQQMTDSPLKTQLAQCASNTFYRTDFAIGHRGAAMLFPEHTKESYQAAINSGAGIVECDVTFTSDKELVCRHSQCDLADTTNILALPELASKCSSPFVPADPANGVSASATCCTTDITLAEFKTLKGKMESSNPQATTVEQYMDSTPSWRSDLYAGNGTLMTHADSIALFKEAGVKMTPELKEASVSMPYNGFTQQDYAKKMLDEYTAVGVDASQVFPQSFNLEDIIYWVENEPEFAKQAVFLDERYEDASFDPQNPATWIPAMADLKTQGVEIIAPPLWALVTLDENNKIIPSEYAKAAKYADLKIITWTLERSGLLTKNKDDWYYQSVKEAINNEGITFELLDVLAKEVGVIGVFSDWPATVTYYDNCMN